jgi:hypothetical protein
MNPTLKKWLSVAATTAAGAAIGYVSHALGEGIPSDGNAWRTLLTGAGIAAASALLHLFQSPPGTISLPIVTEEKKP